MRAFILVVERNLLLRQTLIDLLTALGHEALGTSSAIRGLKLLKHLGFDVLITSPGTTLIEEPSYALEAKKIQPHLKLVIADAIDSPEFSELAIDAFIQKPFSLLALEKTLEKFFISSDLNDDRLRRAPK
jgi:DNA-binding NtrC family response regulator